METNRTVICDEIKRDFLVQYKKEESNAWESVENFVFLAIGAFLIFGEQLGLSYTTNNSCDQHYFGVSSRHVRIWLKGGLPNGYSQESLEICSLTVRSVLGQLAKADMKDARAYINESQRLYLVD